MISCNNGFGDNKYTSIQICGRTTRIGIPTSMFVHPKWSYFPFSYLISGPILLVLVLLLLLFLCVGYLFAIGRIDVAKTFSKWTEKKYSFSYSTFTDEAIKVKVTKQIVDGKDHVTLNAMGDRWTFRPLMYGVLATSRGNRTCCLWNGIKMSPEC